MMSSWAKTIPFFSLVVPLFYWGWRLKWIVRYVKRQDPSRVVFMYVCMYVCMRYGRLLRSTGLSSIIVILWLLCYDYYYIIMMIMAATSSSWFDSFQWPCFSSAPNAPGTGRRPVVAVDIWKVGGHGEGKEGRKDVWDCGIHCVVYHVWLLFCLRWITLRHRHFHLASFHPPLMLIGQGVECSGVEWVALPCLPWSRP